MKRTLLTLAVATLLATSAFAAPIHDAAEKGYISAVKAQLDKGVDVNAKGAHGRTPLHLAALHGHKDVAELLLSKDAEVDATDYDKRTPLYMAAWHAHKDVG